MRLDRLASPASATLVLAALVLQAPAGAQEWNNLGGNAARNGFSFRLGPRTPTPAWTNADDPSIIAWAPFVEDGRVFTVRESGFPQNGGAAGDAIVAYDLSSGAELWRTTLPFGGDTSLEWITSISGVANGQLYATRSQNGSPQPVRALDASSGAPLWTSSSSLQSFAYDGAVFAPDGDLVVADLNKVVRIDSSDGSTVWSTTRSCPVSGNCGPAATATAIYIDQAAPGGNELTKLDMATGAILYSSQVMPGFTDQNTPFLSHDGETVYFARTQNNPAVDLLYAFHDDGSAFNLLWSRPVRWSTSHEQGIGPDGSIYTFLPSDEFVRLDPATGNVTANAGVLSPLGSPNVSPKTVVDARGSVYVSNGWASSPASDGRMWAFDADLSTTLFTLNLDRPNQGGPVLGEDGTLVLCDRSSVQAYRELLVPQTYCSAKTNSDGCAPPIYADGVPSASSGSGFSVGAWALASGNNGLFFYSSVGSAAVPFQGGFLCVATPTFRTQGQNSGGAGSCGGSFAFDFNTYVTSGADPALTSGTDVWGQYWSRDPASPSGTSLSNAIAFTVGP